MKGSWRREIESQGSSWKMKCAQFVDEDLLVLGSSNEDEQNQLFGFNLRNFEWFSCPMSGNTPSKSSFYLPLISDQHDRLFVLWNLVESGLYATVNQDYRDEEGFHLDKGQLVTVFENTNKPVEGDDIEYVYCITQEREVGEVPKSYVVLEEENNFFDTFEHSSLQLSVLTFEDMKWTTVVLTGKDIPRARRDFSSNFVDNCIYLFGGISDSEVIHNDVYKLNLGMLQALQKNLERIVLMIETNSWEKLNLKDDEKPAPRYGHSTSLISSNFVIMFGGLDYQEYRNDLYIFDVKSKEWSQIEIDFGPCARAFHSVIKLDESLIFFGGDGPQGMLNDLFILNISESKWNEIQCDGDIPSRRIRAYLGLKEGQLLCFGGEDCNGRQFDLLSLTLSSRDLEQKPNPAEKNVETINESHQSPSCEEPAKTDDGFVVDFENFTFTIEEDEDETPDIDTTRTTSDSIDAIFDQISNGQDTISVDSLIKCIGNCRIAEHELTWDTILNIVVRITANTDLNQIEASSLQHNRIDCKQFREIANEIAKLKFPSQDSPLEQLIEDYLLPYHTSKKQDMVMNEIYSLPCIMLFLRYSAFLKEIFDIYSSKQKAQAVNKFISLDSFLSFTETFDLVPEKISKTVAESIFNSCFLSEDSSISKTDQGINYPQFLEALGRIAIYIFATKHKNTMAEHMTLLFDALGFFSGNRYNTFLKRARSTNRSNNTNNTKGDIKSTPNKPREIEQKYVDLLQNKHELKAELHNIFMYYCSFGNRLNLDLMSSFKFRLFIRDTNIYTYGFKQESADLIFIKVITNNASKTSNSQKMGFPQFIECLKEIANKLRPTLAPSKAFAQFLLVDVLPNVNRLGSASKCDIGEEAATTAERIFESVRRNLQRLFILYCNSNSTVHYKSVQDTMYLDDFLKLATDFNLIPLISKKDMYGIFKSCLSNADTESLSYQKFEEALLKYAQTAFSKYPYDFKYPSTESKLSLLFEKMELTEWNLLRKRLEKLGRCNIPSPVKSKTKPAN